MSTACPKPDDLLRFADGELTENRAAALRRHVAACPGCTHALAAHHALVARLAAPVAEPGADAVRAVMRRLDAAPAPRPPSARRRPVVALAAAAAAALLAIAVAPLVRRGPAEFAPRGAAEIEWRRKVGVELWALEGTPRRLTPDAAIGPGCALVASYSNVDAAPAHLLAFAFDGRGEIHWLYPAFLDARTDPESARLAPAVVNRALPESVVLEGVAPGPLIVVTIVTRDPLHVSDVEALPPALRTPDGVRGRWPAARVDALPLRFDPTLSSPRTAP